MGQTHECTRDVSVADGTPREHKIALLSCQCVVCKDRLREFDVVDGDDRDRQLANRQLADFDAD